MHYANGREAKVGDLVRGRGYNVKYDITGLLIFASPNSSACNCRVAHAGPDSVVWYGHGGTREQFNKAVAAGWTLSTRVEASIEYGQLDAFVAINPETGEVLPPSGASEEDTFCNKLVDRTDQYVAAAETTAVAEAYVASTEDPAAAVDQMKRGWSDQDRQLLKDTEQSLHEGTTDK